MIPREKTEENNSENQARNKIHIQRFVNKFLVMQNFHKQLRTK